MAGECNTKRLLEISYQVNQELLSSTHWSGSTLCVLSLPGPWRKSWLTGRLESQQFLSPSKCHAGSEQMLKLFLESGCKQQKCIQSCFHRRWLNVRKSSQTWRAQSIRQPLMRLPNPHSFYAHPCFLPHKSVRTYFLVPLDSWLSMLPMAQGCHGVSL